ncbi:hypothetical protein HDU93_008623 [Gonapodya sp. JEL0774]|nr:hypothetical protein HDU93_008623 [Gonapodya sp. JEL0774]
MLLGNFNIEVPHHSPKQSKLTVRVSPKDPKYIEFEFWAEEFLVNAAGHVVVRVPVPDAAKLVEMCNSMMKPTATAAAVQGFVKGVSALNGLVPGVTKASAGETFTTERAQGFTHWMLAVDLDIANASVATGNLLDM